MAPKRTNEEDILYYEKKLRKLREKSSGTSISINGEYKSRGSGTSQIENQPRRDSNENLSPTSPVAEPNIQAGSEPLARSDATAARDPSNNVKVGKPQSAMSETRVSLNPVVLQCPMIETGKRCTRSDVQTLQQQGPEVEPGEITLVEERTSRIERRTSMNTVEGHSPRSKSRALFEVEAHGSRNKPKEIPRVVEPRSPRSEPRRNMHVEEASSSRRESLAISSPVQEQSSRIETRSILKNSEAHSSRNEPVFYFLSTEDRSLESEPRPNLTVLDLEPEISAHTDTPLRPQPASSLESKQSKKKKTRTSSETTDAKTPRNKSRNNSETSVEEDSENNSLLNRKEALLKALGDNLSLSGELIHPSLAQTWSTILRKGLPNDVKEKLLKEYFTPDNCKLLKAPALNDEIANVVEFPARNRDRILENKQNQLGLGIIAIGRAITVLINRGDNYEINAMQHLNHGCRALLDLHHTETKSRRHLFKKDLVRSAVFKDLAIHKLDRDDTLFGSKVTRMIKKQGIPMTPINSRRGPSPAYRDPGMANRGRNFNDAQFLAARRN